MSRAGPSSVQRLAAITAWLGLLAAIALTFWSWSSEGIAFDLFRGDMDAAWKVDRLRACFRSFGSSAPLVYFLFVTIEVVVAPLPGLMLYAPGGLLFGALGGGALALAGNVVGAGIACQAMRVIRPRCVERFFARESLVKVRDALERRGGWLVFLLRLNPLTSSDLVSYAAGLTTIPVWQVMLATCVGMAPLCFAQAWLVESLMTAFPQLLYPLAIACLVYLVVLVHVARRLLRAD